MGAMQSSTVPRPPPAGYSQDMTDVTLLTAHPLEESFNATLADAWARGATRAGATVHRFDATRLEFDPVLRKKNMTPADDEPDLARVRAAVDRSRHVTLLFPTWWVGLPGPLKALIDRLLLPGWAYRYEGRALPTGLMAGKNPAEHQWTVAIAESLVGKP